MSTATKPKLRKPPTKSRIADSPKGTAVAGRKRLEPKEGDEGLFGQHLAALVAQAGMTVDQFAEAIGKDRDTVTLYFGGHRTPKLKDYRRIAVALGLANLRDLIPDVPLAKRRKK